MATYSVHKTITFNPATFSNDETRKLVSFDLDLLRDNTKIGIPSMIWINKMRGAKSQRVCIEIMINGLRERNNPLYQKHFGHTCRSMSETVTFEVCVDTPEELVVFAHAVKNFNPSMVSPTRQDTGDTLGKQINAKDYTLANAQEAFEVLRSRMDAEVAVA